MCLLASIFIIGWCLVVLASFFSDWLAGFFLPICHDDDEMGISLSNYKGWMGVDQ